MSSNTELPRPRRADAVRDDELPTYAAIWTAHQTITHVVLSDVGKLAWDLVSAEIALAEAANIAQWAATNAVEKNEELSDARREHGRLLGAFRGER